ncbi:MAG TPA: cation diffusion facilitator family transporter [Roseiflexaceae bacterium]|nr:cation diffusion facilitator family transporter [Roseiflexaceae bacterium]
MSHPSTSAPNTPPLTRYAWLSIGAAVLTIGLKTLAYQLTGSVGLLSDALESLVNLAAAIMALAMLIVAARPPDAEHAYGHGKAEYFASAAEGALILAAAASIGVTAWDRLLHPQPLEQPALGLAISTGASLVNFGVAQVLLRAGRRHQSIALEADAHHLMTDVWTSAGVLAAVGMVALTGWAILDPIIALLVAANILRTGVQLLRRSTSGLMDTALAPDEQARVQGVLERYARAEGIRYHALRTRQAGARRFVSFHVIVPGWWTVQRGHQLLERIERDIRAAMPHTTVFTHLESLDDPASWQDQTLDRGDDRDTTEVAGVER